MVDVPFIAQTEDLCGGAAAAMVLRYWGGVDVQAEDFASLVDRDKGGINAFDLVRALTSRGLTVRPIRAEGEDVAHEVSRGRPVVALIDAGGGRFHYVVIVGWASGKVLFHDPSVGPFRVRSEVEFRRSWQVTDGFALVITPAQTAPRERAPKTLPEGPRTTSGKTTPCDGLVDRAMAMARGPDPEAAVSALTAATELCPDDARSRAALSGVRFRQERWRESADFARQATERDATDAESWRLLGATLYLSDEPRPALKAWNRIDEPRLDRVEIGGLVRTRQDIATEALGLRPREVLTEEAIAKAERRLDQLPTAANARIAYRPQAGGRADVVAAVGERALIERWPVLLLRIGVEAIARREAKVQVNSPTHRGERLEMGGRFAARRPSFWAALDTPRLFGLPGVVSLSGLWDRQTYAPQAADSLSIVETRRRGAIDWSHWVTANARTDLGFALDVFKGRGAYMSICGGADQRMMTDRVALVGAASSWIGSGGARPFGEFAAAVAFRSGVRPRRASFTIRVDGRRASGDAPLAVWPGAGTGPGRPWLLRALPLLEEGELVGAAFGRGLIHATAEAELQMLDRGAARLGLAAFVDFAKPWDTRIRPGAGPGIFALGAGLRLYGLSSTAFRIDIAKRPGHDGVVLSAGVIPRWPR